MLRIFDGCSPAVGKLTVLRQPARTPRHLLADYDQAQQLEALLGKGADTTLIPVFYKASKEALSKARGEGYKYVINANKNLDHDISKALF